MTAFILIHTALSVPAIFFGLAGFIRDGGIDPTTRRGKLYIASMAAGSFSAFGFIPTFGFTLGQVLTLIVLALLAIGTLTAHGDWRKAGYVQSIALTTSYLLLMVFTTTEVLKKVPLGQPFATSADDPSLLPVRLGLLVGYLFVLGRQVRTIRSQRGIAARYELILGKVRSA